ncbi:hypothetical protein ACFO4E_25575 [Nocardiopsis mangrovi]|uniref:Uncharacterized protein n=1 Tax=Nocardiopsis mangrovi TaxID=1179818 RepID=A0ABV9E5K5_9ACTN
MENHELRHEAGLGRVRRRRVRIDAVLADLRRNEQRRCDTHDDAAGRGSERRGDSARGHHHAQ